MFCCFAFHGEGALEAVGAGLSVSKVAGGDVVVEVEEAAGFACWWCRRWCAGWWWVAGPACSSPRWCRLCTGEVGAAWYLPGFRGDVGFEPALDGGRDNVGTGIACALHSWEQALSALGPCAVHGLAQFCVAGRELT